MNLNTIGAAELSYRFTYGAPLLRSWIEIPLVLTYFIKNFLIYNVHTIFVLFMTSEALGSTSKVSFIWQEYIKAFI